MFDIKRDGETRATVASVILAVGWLHQRVPYSASHATTYEGWSVVDAESGAVVNLTLP